MTNVTSWLKQMARGIGLEVFKLNNLPLGVNPYKDIKTKNKGFDPETLFDIGANIGQTSGVLRKFFPDANIYAFEPVTSTFLELSSNMEGKNIITFNVGFGDYEKEDKIYLQTCSYLNSIVEDLNKPDENIGGAEKIRLLTVDGFCDCYNIKNIDFLKIDTEGYGLNILKGAKKMLERGSIQWIYIEVGFFKEDLRHDYFFHINKLLSNARFQLFGFYDQWIENDKLIYCNALYYYNQNKN